MKKIYKNLLATALIIGGLTISAAVSAEEFSEKTYKPTWESLRQHQAVPEWFKNDKFGIYFHWGV